MDAKQWYEVLFENYAQSYDNECFTQGTIGECDFIEQELQNNTSLSILDVGCGTGRHAIELAKRGYSVCGIDLSSTLLDKAKQKASDAGVTVNFLHHDARNLPFTEEFDVAIMLCEGGFPLMETDLMNFEILRNVTKSLRMPSVFIFTTLNGLFPLYHNINDFHASGNAQEGNATYRSTSFDLMTFRDYNETTYTDDNGNTHTLLCNERYYMPTEITWMLSTLGYTSIEIFGARLGAFSRNHSLKTDDFEMLVVAKR